jgi:hypothetical protein
MGAFAERRSHLLERYEAWWRREPLHHPIVRITAPCDPGGQPERPPQADAPAEGSAHLRQSNHAAPPLYRWFTEPEIVLPRLERRIEAAYYAGDAFPWIDPVSLNLAAIQAAYMGAPYRIDPVTLTGWAGALIHAWSPAPPLQFDPANPWWTASLRLLEAAARRSQGRYAIAIPDLQGGGEILALLRGTEQLALDLVDCPDRIPPALDAVNRAWLEYYTACNQAVYPSQGGYLDWLGIWSSTPAVTIECDFMVMISPKMFRRYFLPALEQQTAWIERTVFHLDGPQALPHLDALLSLPRLHAIQWIPTPDRPQMTNWIPLLKKIQQAGKSVVVECAPGEVIPLLRSLNRDKIILTTQCGSKTEADALAEEIQKF